MESKYDEFSLVAQSLTEPWCTMYITWFAVVASFCEEYNSSKYAKHQEDLHDESNVCLIVELERD